MSKSREIVGQELKILEDLFDLALAVYGVKDKKFVNLTAKETRELQEAIVGYVVRHADPKSARYAKSEDARG